MSKASLENLRKRSSAARLIHAEVSPSEGFPRRCTTPMGGHLGETAVDQAHPTVAGIYAPVDMRIPNDHGATSTRRPPLVRVFIFGGRHRPALAAYEILQKSREGTDSVSSTSSIAKGRNARTKKKKKIKALLSQDGAERTPWPSGEEKGELQVNTETSPSPRIKPKKKI